MLIITPGTQLSGDAKNDQMRIATPEQAIRAGATHLVIGRSISQSANPVASFSAILAQVAAASARGQA